MGNNEGDKNVPDHCIVTHSLTIPCTIIMCGWVNLHYGLKISHCLHGLSNSHSSLITNGVATEAVN